MFKTKYLKLTKEQKERGVIYSSCLYVTNKPGYDTTLHEVFADDPDKWRKIDNLTDTSFFKQMARDFGLDVINEVRR